MAFANMPVVPQARAADGLSAREVAEPAYRRRVECICLGAREQSDDVTFDEPAQAIRPCRIVDAQYSHRHCANDIACPLFQWALLFLEFPTVAVKARRRASHIGRDSPARHCGMIAAAHQRLPDEQAEDRAPMISAAISTAAVLGQALAKRGAGARGETMRPYADQSWGGCRIGRVLIEKEVDPCPRQAPEIEGTEGHRPALAILEAGEQRMKARKVGSNAHRRGASRAACWPSQANCSPWRNPSIGTDTRTPAAMRAGTRSAR